MLRLMSHRARSNGADIGSRASGGVISALASAWVVPASNSTWVSFRNRAATAVPGGTMIGSSFTVHSARRSAWSRPDAFQETSLTFDVSRSSSPDLEGEYTLPPSIFAELSDPHHRRYTSICGSSIGGSSNGGT